MAVPNHYPVLQAFWQANASRFNFATQEGCGKFTEEFLVHLIDETNDYHYAHLRKYGAATQYNGHAVDVIAYDNRSYDDGTDIMEVDIIASAESANASHSWQVRETQYTAEELMNPSEVQGGSNQPFPTYEELGGDGACEELIGVPLELDYAEAHQPMNAGSSVWVNRTVYDALNWTVVQGMPSRVAYQKSCEKRRPEWREALGLNPIVNADPKSSNLAYDVKARQLPSKPTTKEVKDAVDKGYDKPAFPTPPAVKAVKVEGDKLTVTKVEKK